MRLLLPLLIAIAGAGVVGYLLGRHQAGVRGDNPPWFGLAMWSAMGLMLCALLFFTLGIDL